MSFLGFGGYPKAQSYEIVNLIVVIFAGGVIVGFVDFIIAETMLLPSNQLIIEIFSQGNSTSTNVTNHTSPANSTNQLLPTILSNHAILNNFAMLTAFGLGVFYLTPIIVSLAFTQVQPTRIASPRYMQYVGIVSFFIIDAAWKFEGFGIMLLLAAVSPLSGKFQDSAITSLFGFSGTARDMMVRVVKMNTSLENALSIFRLDKHRKRFGNFSELEESDKGIWRGKSTGSLGAFYIELRSDLSKQMTILSMVQFKKTDYSIMSDDDIKEILRVRVAYLKEFMHSDYAIEVVDTTNILAAGLAQYAQNDISGWLNKFENLGRFQLSKHLAFGALVVLAGAYLLSTHHVVEGIGLIVPSAGYVIYEVGKNKRES